MKAHDHADLFCTDPRDDIPDYSLKIDYPMCLNWIDENIRLTEKTTQLQARQIPVISFEM